eukprot:scaffold8229_cov57-Phaeocystis_antarctica.AAC.1
MLHRSLHWHVSQASAKRALVWSSCSRKGARAAIRASAPIAPPHEYTRKESNAQAKVGSRVVCKWCARPLSARYVQLSYQLHQSAEAKVRTCDILKEENGSSDVLGYTSASTTHPRVLHWTHIRSITQIWPPSGHHGARHGRHAMRPINREGLHLRRLRPLYLAKALSAETVRSSESYLTNLPPTSLLTVGKEAVFMLAPTYLVRARVRVGAGLG